MRVKNKGAVQKRLQILCNGFNPVLVFLQMNCFLWFRIFSMHIFCRLFLVENFILFSFILTNAGNSLEKKIH